MKRALKTPRIVTDALLILFSIKVKERAYTQFLYHEIYHEVALMW